MMQHTQLRFDLSESGGKAEWQASLDHLKKTFLGPDEKREKVARGFQAILQASGLPDPGASALNYQVYGHLSEDSAQYIGAKWLMFYHHLVSEREQFARATKPYNLEPMLMHAEELGRLQERLYWRQGEDETTGKRRETLGLAGRKQVRNGRDGNAMRTKESFQVKHGAAAQVWANELHKSKPSLSWAAIQTILAKQFKVSAETIKRSLRNPKKEGQPGASDP